MWGVFGVEGRREGGREQGRRRRRRKRREGRVEGKEGSSRGLLFILILHQTARVVLHSGVDVDTRPHLLPGDKHPASVGFSVQPCGCKGEMPGSSLGPWNKIMFRDIPQGATNQIAP